MAQYFQIGLHYHQEVSFYLSGFLYEEGLLALLLCLFRRWLLFVLRFVQGSVVVVRLRCAF